MKEVVKQVKALNIGDLVKVAWFDASTGKSLSGGSAGIDVPVQSWSIFLGVLGEKNKHIILAQNSFRYADGIYDIDYTAVPTTWTVNITVIIKNHIKPEEATNRLNSFPQNAKRTNERKIEQQKVRNHHDRLDQESTNQNQTTTQPTNHHRTRH
jgi:hypothetical protein